MNHVLRKYVRSLLQEMKPKFVDIVGSIDKSRLPFSNLFDGKLRVSIPYRQEWLKDYEYDIKEQEPNLKFDVENGTVYKTVKTRNGEKQVTQRLGKFINNNLKNYFNNIKNDMIKSGIQIDKNNHVTFPLLADTKGKSLEKIIMSSYYFNDISNLYSNLENENDIQNIIDDLISFRKLYKIAKKYNEIGSGYSIVISRAPIDVLRASDFKNIQSCHSQGGKYFNCAIDEAKSGGLVAFSVKSEDLEGVDLQQEEVFEDKERGIDGIKPIARVRLRKFDNKKENYSLAIPEIFAYGLEDEDFVGSVRNWAYKNQSERFYNKDDDKLKFPNLKSFVLDGSYYEDTPPHVLFNNFFDFKFYKRKDNNIEDMIKRYKKEVKYISSNFSFKHCDFIYDIEEYDNTKIDLSWSGSITIEFDFNIFSHNIFLTSKTIEDLNYKLGLSLSDVKQPEIEKNKIIIEVAHEVYSGYPSDFEGFLKRLKLHDNSYEQIKSEILRLISKYDNQYAYDLTNLKLQDVSVEMEYGHVTIKPNIRILLDLKERLDFDIKREFEKSVRKFIYNQYFSKLLTWEEALTNMVVILDEDVLNVYLDFEIKNIVPKFIKVVKIFDKYYDNISEEIYELFFKFTHQ